MKLAFLMEINEKALTNVHRNMCRQSRRPRLTPEYFKSKYNLAVGDFNL
jgi:hypothetical protein